MSDPIDRARANAKLDAERRAFDEAWRARKEANEITLTVDQSYALRLVCDMLHADHRFIRSCVGCVREPVPDTFVYELAWLLPSGEQFACTWRVETDYNIDTAVQTITRIEVRREP